MLPAFVFQTANHKNAGHAFKWFLRNRVEQQLTAPRITVLTPGHCVAKV